MGSKNKLVYSKDLDTTYIMSPDGKSQIGYMEGDQRNNPLAYEQNVSDVMNVSPPLTERSIPDRMAQMGKDFVVNAAANAPLAFGPQNIPLAGLIRTGASLGLGAGLDSLLNPQKNGADIAGTALMNTGTGLVIPWAMEKVPSIGKFNIPGMRTERTSVRVAEPTMTERTTTGTSEGTSSGTSNRVSQGSYRSTGASSTERVGNSETTSKGNTITNQNSQGHSEAQDITLDVPHSEAMVTLEAEIERLKTINPKNKSQATQVANAIARNETALNALKDASVATKYVRDSFGKYHLESERAGVSNTTSKGTSNTLSESRGTSQGTSQGESQGSSNRESTSTSTGSTTPGKVTSKSVSVTTGGSKFERIVDAIKEMHLNTHKQLTDMQKWLYGQLLGDLIHTKDNINN